jgi:hypothetical protein
VRVAELAVGEDGLRGGARQRRVSCVLKAGDGGLGDGVPDVEAEVEQSVFGRGGFRDVEIGDEEGNEERVY